MPNPRKQITARYLKEIKNLQAKIESALKDITEKAPNWTGKARTMDKLIAARIPLHNMHWNMEHGYHEAWDTGLTGRE
ncbi:MAG: hypothetical protein ABMA13_22220 [Chthoniobacteraceae bacterium]